MGADQDFFFTVESNYRAPELKVRGSRFISEIIPLISKSDVDDQLSKSRKEFYDATHHCYAYRLGIQGDQIRAADDGEPAGTAGRPILNSLANKDITNCLLVVTRYYGGTNLGTGGLCRAYAEASQMAVMGAKIQTIFLTETFILSLQYESIPTLYKLLTTFATHIYDAEYTDCIILKVNIRKSLAGRFRTELQEIFYHGEVVIIGI